MLDDKRKPERPETKPLDLEQLLEIELMQKRAAWQQRKARRGILRALSLFFLFVVVLAALVGFFVFLSPDRVNELKSSTSQHAPITPSPTSSPR